jgi:hypothetical protein
MPFVDLLHFKNNSTDYMSQKISEKVRRKKKEGKIFRKNQLKKSQNPLNLGKKSQNPEKNCRDFLIPKIFVRFFQSNLPLGKPFLGSIEKPTSRRQTEPNSLETLTLF